MHVGNVLLVHPYSCIIAYFWHFIVLSFEVVNNRICIRIYHETDSAVDISKCGNLVVFTVYLYFAVHANIYIVRLFNWFIHKVCPPSQFRVR